MQNETRGWFSFHPPLTPPKQISHVAEIIHLQQQIVERKLSQMILDKQLHGILDQGTGCLELFDESHADKTYEAALETILQTSNVVNALYKKAQKLV